VLLLQRVPLNNLPGYESKYEQLKKFVDDVYCVSVNDAFVMNAWFKDLNIKKVKANR
jgi:peroxiredoxin